MSLSSESVPAEPITVPDAIPTRFDHHIVQRTIHLHGMTVAYRMIEAGPDKPRLVLIHGMAGSSRMWEPAMSLLDGHASVLAVDLLGHGGSARGRSLDYSIGNQASIVRDVMVRVGFGAATIVGQSLGGGVAMQFAYQFPERVERLALVSSGGLGPEVSPFLRAASLPGSELVLPVLTHRWVRAVGRGLDRVIGGHLPATVHETMVSFGSLGDPATRSAFVHTARSVIDVRGQRIDGRDRLYLAADLPLLVVWGGRDAIIPVTHAHGVAEAVPSARLEIFENAGHFPHLTEPARLARLLRSWHEGTEPAVLDAGTLTQRLVGHAAG